MKASFLRRYTPVASTANVWNVQGTGVQGTEKAIWAHNAVKPAKNDIEIALSRIVDSSEETA